MLQNGKTNSFKTELAQSQEQIHLSKQDSNQQSEFMKLG